MCQTEESMNSPVWLASFISPSISSFLMSMPKFLSMFWSSSGVIWPSWSRSRRSKAVRRSKNKAQVYAKLVIVNDPLKESFHKFMAPQNSFDVIFVVSGKINETSNTFTPKSILISTFLAHVIFSDF